MKTVMPPFLHVVGCAVAVNAFTFWVLGGGAFGWEVLLWEGALAFALRSRHSDHVPRSLLTGQIKWL